MNGVLIFGKFNELKKTLIELNFQIVLYNDMALTHTLVVDVRSTVMTTAIFNGKKKESWTKQLMWAFHASHEWVVNSECWTPAQANDSVCFTWQEMRYDSFYRRLNHSIILAHYVEVNSVLYIRFCVGLFFVHVLS